jgi:hypothetical protein
MNSYGLKSLVLALLLGPLAAARPTDCLLTPVPEHVRHTPFLIRATALRILDGASAQGREHRTFSKQMDPALDTVHRGHTALVRIDEDYKGRWKAGDTVAVYSDYSFNQTAFRVGRHYVLFLHLEHGRHFITGCSYSQELDGSTATEALLAVIQREAKKKQKGG